ncbi:MAG: transporter [Rhodococcus sp. (in: high G+C Gram-positive bacteria)]|uniref:PH-like domain-containing protein n=1 Tax=Rhodococcus sp. TaxID=1831 RepID=UPI003BAFF034
MERLLWVVGLVVFWALALFLMYVGWRGRARRQNDRIGQLPAVPAQLGQQTISPSTGLYVGSTLAPSWQDRIAVGDLGFRAAGELSRYETGILLERDGASAIWIPQDSIRAIRTERGLAGKVMSKDGVLVIRWELPTGTEIDTGFRGDDKSVYPDWVSGVKSVAGTDVAETDNEDSANAASSGETLQNGENA